MKPFGKGPTLNTILLIICWVVLGLFIVHIHALPWNLDPGLYIRLSLPESLGISAGIFLLMFWWMK